MSKPKAPRWLTEAFADGVDERAEYEASPMKHRRIGGVPACWLAQHDPARRPCSGKLERFHFIPRQRVEHALGAMLLWATFDNPDDAVDDDSLARELVLLASWDPRNGGIACEHHHRRFDGHATPALRIAWDYLPDHVDEFAMDWGLTDQLERRFPQL